MAWVVSNSPRTDTPQRAGGNRLRPFCLATDVGLEIEAAEILKAGTQAVKRIVAAGVLFDGVPFYAGGLAGGEQMRPV